MEWLLKEALLGVGGGSCLKRQCLKGARVKEPEISAPHQLRAYHLVETNVLPDQIASL